MQEKKLCPMIWAPTRSIYNERECFEERCAWWDQLADACCIASVAARLQAPREEAAP